MSCVEIVSQIRFFISHRSVFFLVVNFVILPMRITVIPAVGQLRVHRLYEYMRKQVRCASRTYLLRAYRDIGTQTDRRIASGGPKHIGSRSIYAEEQRDGMTLPRREEDWIYSRFSSESALLSRLRGPDSSWIHNGFDLIASPRCPMTGALTIGTLVRKFQRLDLILEVRLLGVSTVQTCRSIPLHQALLHDGQGVPWPVLLPRVYRLRCCLYVTAVYSDAGNLGMLDERDFVVSDAVRPRCQRKIDRRRNRC